jgi:hypothetical protein
MIARLIKTKQKQNKQITNKQSNKQQTKQNNNVMTTTWFYSQQRTRTIW